MSPALSTECIPASHVMSTEAHPKLAASKLPTFPIASTDTIPASHVKSKKVPVSQVLSTETIPEQPMLTMFATKAIPAAFFQPIMVKEAISEFPAVPVVFLSGCSTFWPWRPFQRLSQLSQSQPWRPFSSSPLSGPLFWIPPPPSWSFLVLFCPMLGEGTIRILPSLSCQPCHCLMCLCLFCAWAHGCVFVCVGHVLPFSCLCISSYQAPLFSPCLSDCAHLFLLFSSPLYCSPFISCVVSLLF